MQKVRPKQEVEQTVSLSTSISTVKTLLSTGVGCISYLRGLFPEDNFLDSKIEAPRPPLSSHDSSGGGAKGSDEKRNAPSIVRVKKLSRGKSDEGDRLLDYLETGASDALEKSYLHQLMLAIYLDPDDPTNIVECYTFTFNYMTDSKGNKVSLAFARKSADSPSSAELQKRMDRGGAKLSLEWEDLTRHPEMIVRDKMNGLVLSDYGGGSQTKGAVKEGQLKRQVQKLIRNLIASTQALDELPRRRFITVRLYYTEDTPIDYEPPHFSPVAPENANFRITTSKIDEVPDPETLGSINTGSHGVTLQMVSIAPMLEAPCDEIISAKDALERNKLDAKIRRVQWDANSLVTTSVNDEDEKRKEVKPIGVWDGEGKLRNLEDVSDGDVYKELREAIGMEEKTDWQKLLPQREKDIVLAVKNGKGRGDNENIKAILQAKASKNLETPTSSIVPSTQITPVVSRKQSIHPAVPLLDETLADYGPRATSIIAVNSSGTLAPDKGDQVDMEVVEEMEEPDTEPESDLSDVDERMAQLPPVTASTAPQDLSDAFPVCSLNNFALATDETQLLEYTQRAPCAQIESDTQSRPVLRSRLATNTTSTSSHTEGKRGKESSSNLQDLEEPEKPFDDIVVKMDVSAPKGVVNPCECGDASDDDSMVLCAKCGDWKHVICYGYHNEEDSRIPEVFTCYPCRVRLSSSEALLDPQRECEVQEALNKLRSIALFRRAIDVVRTEGVMETASFSKRLGVDKSTALQVSRRLRTENFVLDHHSYLNPETGLRRIGRRAKVQFSVNKSKAQKKVADQIYFSPGQGAEAGLEMVLMWSQVDAAGSQEESQITFDASAPTKIAQVPIDVVGSKQPQVIAKTPEKGQKLNRKETIDEDPIVDDDIETATSREHPSRQFVTTPIANPREVKKPAPYIPSFGKGKGKTKVVGGNFSDFRRASSITPLNTANDMSSTLRDRINALNATTNGTSAPPAQASSSNSHPTGAAGSVRDKIGRVTAPLQQAASSSHTTGAAGSIRDKIGRFQAHAETAPLVPIGSFGLGGVRRDPSTVDGKEKGRVASLGGGRANVPLGVVTASRSVSMGSGVRANKDDTDRGSQHSSSRSSSIDRGIPASPVLSSPNSSEYQTPPVDPNTASALIIPSAHLANLRADSTMSVSSMNVETGSTQSGDDSLDTPTSQSAYASPISSPIFLPVLVPATEPIALKLDSTPLDDISTSPTLLRGPLAALRGGPTRTTSNFSVSSMLVEDGSQASDGVANLSELAVGTEVREEVNAKPVPTIVGESESDNVSGGASEQTEEANRMREEQTKLELEKYEREVEDATAAPIPPSMETRETVLSSTPVEEKEEVQEEKKVVTPVLSTFATLPSGQDLFATSVSVSSLSSLTSKHSIESDIGDHRFADLDVTPEHTPKIGSTEYNTPRSSGFGAEEDHFGPAPHALETDGESGYGDILEDFTADEKVVPPSPGMPKVRCNDCSEEVELTELADHTCAPSRLPPAILKSPVLHPIPSLAPPASHPDVPLDDEEGPEIAGAFPSPTTLRLLQSTRRTSEEGRRAPPGSIKSPLLDSFISVPESSVPDDVDHEDDENFFKPISQPSQAPIGSPRIPTIPNLYDDLPDSPTEHEVPASFRYLASTLARRQSEQKSIPGVQGGSDPSSPDLAGWGNRTSMVGGVPGVDDDEDEAFEGGSVTFISRSTATHRAQSPLN